MSVALFSCLSMRSPVSLFALLFVTTLALGQNSDLASVSSSSLPDAPGAALFQQGSEPQLQSRPPAPEPAPPAPAAHGRSLAIVNGMTYQRPSGRDTFIDYLHDTYGLAAQGETIVRTLYAQGRGLPVEWSQDWPGFGYRFGSQEGITIISGNTRYAMELIFKEDLRYVVCRGCSVKSKIVNALLAEITARHDIDGHRFFTLTPTVAGFSGPIIAHTLWYPGPRQGPLAGVVSARLYFATNIGGHLFQEFVMEHYRKRTNREPNVHSDHF